MSARMSVSMDATTFLCLLCLLFVALKLTGHIGWSWWWVTAPVWIPVSLGVVFVILIVGVTYYFEKQDDE